MLQHIVLWKIKEDFQGVPKSQLIKEIGQPVNYNHKYITKIKLDLIEYSVFKWQNDYYILGYGQHDRETPVFLCSQKLLS